MFSCWIFQILNGSDTVALTCYFAEDFVYQIGKLFFEDDDQTDQYNENQDDLFSRNSFLPKMGLFCRFRKNGLTVTTIKDS